MAPTLAIPAVNAAIFNDRGEILLTRRSAVVRAPGQWVLPGGHVEIGEEWEVACRREVREEVGIEVESLRLLGLYSDPALTVTAEVLSGGHYGQFVVALYLVNRFRGDISPNEEVDQWGWYPPDRLPSPMLKSHPIRVRDAFRGGREVFIR